MSTIESTLEAAAAETAAAAEVKPGWFETAFSKIAGLRWEDWMLLAVLVLAAILVFSEHKRSGKRKWTPKMMAVGAICLALSAVLSLIRLWRMPMGGSITPASMLPLLLFAAYYGLVPGLLLGTLYGFIDFALGAIGLSVGNPAAFLLDQILAYTALGLCALTTRELPRDDTALRWRLLAGIVIGCAARFLCSFLSGWLIYGEYCGYYGFASPVLYSICYNGAYMLPNCVICGILGWIIGPRVVRELKRLR